MVAVKICGVRTIEIASLCAEVEADFAGLNFVPTARRRVGLKEARRIRQALGAVPAVGVFRDTPDADVLRAVDEIQLDWVQLHGAESPASCARIRAQGVRVIKGMPVTGTIGTIASDIQRYRHVADILLLDAPLPGSGATWSWETIARYRAQLVAPDIGAAHPLLFVAGGLTSDNVGTAITLLAPDGVDVASGVESDGDIDPVKVRTFCSAARSLQTV